MFDGVPADQFHQFIAAASSRTSLPIPLSFPLHHHHHHHHHNHHHGVPIPSPPAPPPPQPPPPVITPTPNPTPAPAFLGCFDLYPSPHQILEVVHQPHQPHHHHLNHGGGRLHPPPPPQLHQHQSPPTDTRKNEDERNLEMVEEEERSIPVVANPSAAAPADHHHHRPWSNDEVLTLLRIRSGMENWFPEFTWEHVSRKLGEHGYERSAEKCKEKFEEESRHFNSMGYAKNYRFFTDLDELYDDDNPQVSNNVKGQDLGKEKDEEEDEEEEEEDDKMVMSQQQQQEETENVQVTAGSNPCEENTESAVRNKKRKRKHKFEMFKGFCEAVVKRIVAQQEDLHDKLIEDMLKRDEESIAKEEAWKCQEMDRINREIEIRAQEHVIAGDRQAKIVDLLRKFTSSGTSQQDQNLITKIEDFFKVRKSCTTCLTTSSSEILPCILIETASSMSNVTHDQNPTLLPTSSTETTPSPHNHYSTLLPTTSSSVIAAIASQSPNKTSHTIQEDNPFSSPPSFAKKSSPSPSASPQTVQKANETSGERVTGIRWPRDEVQALINLKCSSQITSNGDDNNKEGTKGPLWERISQGMLELGYKRSAKRCKEKWENINKYFRKTKDSNKKRSVESRTCPYFHQLSTLYSQGTLVAPSDLPENCAPTSPGKTSK